MEAKQSVWTWGHIVGTTGGVIQIAGGTVLIVGTGGFAAYFGSPLISSGFSALTYSVTADEFSAKEYAKHCAISATTTGLCSGAGYVLSEAAQGLNLSAKALEVINNNDKAKTLVEGAQTFMQSHQTIGKVVTTGGKGAKVALKGAKNALQYEAISAVVNASVEGDAAVIKKRLTKKRLRASVASASVESLISSSFGHFQGKKIKLDKIQKNTQNFPPFSVRSKELMYKLNGKLGKKILKNISKSVDAALNSVLSKVSTAVTQSILEGKPFQPENTRVFLAVSRRALMGGIGSNQYQQLKIRYKNAVQNEHYLASLLDQLEAVDDKSCADYQALLVDISAKYNGCQALIDTIEGSNQFSVDQLSKLQAHALRTNRKMDLLDEQLSELRGVCTQTQSTTNIQCQSKSINLY